MGKLYLIPTPLSEDSTDFLLPDAKEKVRGLKNFIVENPKVARKYLKSIETITPLQELELYVLDEHTRDNDILRLTKLLKESDVGLMSDAGAPGVADPGGKLVRLAHMNNYEVVPLVGPSSVLLALMASGLNGQSFRFNGYLPVDQEKREVAIKVMERDSLHNLTTQIFMETPYRNKHLWRSLLQECNPTTELTIAVNLTASDQFIKTAKIVDWGNMKHPDLDKKPTMFLLLATRAKKRR